jgi:hypothetical protein
LVSRTARRRSGRVSHLRESVERRKDPVNAPDEGPPILGNWRRLYIIILLYLACIITALYVFTRVFDS